MKKTSEDPFTANKNRKKVLEGHKLSLGSGAGGVPLLNQQINSHSRAGGQQEQKRMTQVTGITFNPLSS